MPDTQAVVRYIRSLPQDFLEWDKLHAKFETTFTSLIGEAQAIERYFQAQVAFQVQHARMELIDGHKCPVINTTVTFISELCNAMHEQFGTDISMSYLIKPDNSAMISLRSAGRVDVSAIAKKHGGGGHHNSAGFHIPVAQLVEFLEGRTLL
jgi:nanoRNase/pAp phosphatase (c-di-AMP/oligoRNAs hydrolase)